VDQPRTYEWIGPVLIIVLSGVAMLALAKPVAGPRFVPRLTIPNPSPIPIDVDVSSDGGHWLPIVAAEPNALVTARDVVDQGSEWTFRFRVAGKTVGTVQRTRDDLADANWRVEIPQRVLNQVVSP
jgi:hypothetical protein